MFGGFVSPMLLKQQPGAAVQALWLSFELQQFVLSDLQLPIIFVTFLEGKHARYKSMLPITFLDYWQPAFLFISFVGQGLSQL